ncbi:MAG: STM4015 family protein [Gemmataceae bacterium]|nr:STM4015 family protein [Gemmataceae bacterium]
MAISKKATEFAGLPVIDYHPAVGLVLPLMTRREFRKEGEKGTWAIRLEGNRLAVGSGAGKAHPTPEAAQAEYRRLIAEKAKDGWEERRAAGGSLREQFINAIQADPADAASRNAFLDYLSEQGETLPAAAYRVECEGYDEEPALPRLRSLLDDPAAGLVQALVIGWWGPESDSDSDEIVAAMIEARDRLPNLRAVFLGDIPYSDNEISWTQQGDLTDLLLAFPHLEQFRSRGSMTLRKFKHVGLKSLALEASNLSREVVKTLGTCDLPALEHLEVWLGTSSYGADTEPGDLKGILQGKGLPSLRSLALRNSEIADAVAAALAKAPVMDRIRGLDLSLGTLGDEGAEALLKNPKVAKLEKLDISHHYVSEPLIERLKGLGIEVVAERADHGDAEDRYVAHAE